MAAANRVAADNPLQGDQTAAPADGGLFPRIAHPYPCGGCAAFHDDESGFCAQCSRRRLVPPHTVAMLARAQRRFYLALLTLIMSMFETSDKVIIATFTASTTLVVLLWFLTKAVASEKGHWIAGLVLVVVAAVCCGPVVRRMIRSIEAVDAISGEFAAASLKLLADRDDAQRGPASFKPSAPPRQPGRELRDIYVKARERRDLFAVEILEAVVRAGKAATEPSRAIRGPSVKHLSRAREKIVLDYGGDARRLRDVLRGSVVCEAVDEIDAVVDALRGVKDVEVIRIKNRFRDKPTPSGYREVLCGINQS